MHGFTRQSKTPFKSIPRIPITSNYLMAVWETLSVQSKRMFRMQGEFDLHRLVGNERIQTEPGFGLSSKKEAAILIITRTAGTSKQLKKAMILVMHQNENSSYMLEISKKCINLPQCQLLLLRYLPWVSAGTKTHSINLFLTNQALIKLSFWTTCTKTYLGLFSL